jgi:hypothetical protein
MKVLLGICIMATRSGAELFVRDLALGLNRRGHSVVVYAPIIGDMVEELREQSIACVSDLESVTVPPDIIIGNTQIETVLCLAHFPGVPAISICHDRVHEHGRPPRFFRIGAYVAVDANCAERLTVEHGIPPTQIHIIQNGVDLRRFRPRLPLPERPRAAAIFSNYATHGVETELVRRACAAEGVALDVIGMGAGNQSTAPEEILHRYDLVFAKARCAMEAMAVGCAVIVLNESLGMAGMVTSANVADWRLWNFGRRLLVRHPIDEARVRDAIQSYSSADAALVSSYIRAHASLEATIEALEKLALEVLQAEAEPIPQRELREFARYVHDFLLAPATTRVAHQVGMMQQEALRIEQEAEHALQRQRKHAEELEKALLIARQKLARSREKLAAVRATYSWRVTWPLRWLRRRVALPRERRDEA